MRQTVLVDEMISCLEDCDAATRNCKYVGKDSELCNILNNDCRLDCERSYTDEIKTPR